MTNPKELFLATVAAYHSYHGIEEKIKSLVQAEVIRSKLSSVEPNSAEESKLCDEFRSVLKIQPHEYNFEQFRATFQALSQELKKHSSATLTGSDSPAANQSTP